jgi:hypothetical protein
MWLHCINVETRFITVKRRLCPQSCHCDNINQKGYIYALEYINVDVFLGG